MRYYVVAAGTGDVAAYTQSYQAYTEEHYGALLSTCGFQEVTFFAGLGEDGSGEGLCAVVAHKA